MKTVLFLLLLIPATVPAQDVSLMERRGISIVGSTRNVPASDMTNFDAGPAVGNMLNAHYFPGLMDYGNGRFDYAEIQMNYVVDRPYYLEQNPRQKEFLSTAHYIRGMIYLYHATGVGRHRLARADFEAAIQWNSNNYIAYLELSRVYSELDLKDLSISIVRRLLDLNPDKVIVERGRIELKKLGVEEKQ
jgi:tetratricopeptide (TPR) repeat protein